VQNYDVSKMIFSEPVKGVVPSQNPEAPKLEYRRILISTRYPDGSKGDLILPTPTVFSFGVKEQLSMDSGILNGYTFPICLWNRDGPTPEEKAFSDKFTEICKNCISYLVENQAELGIETSETELNKTKGGLNPLYWKRELVDEGKKKVSRIVAGTGPTLYTKILYFKKSQKNEEKFLTPFSDMDTGKEIHPLELLDKLCHANCAIKIESIFLGSKISLQIKLYECNIRLATTGIKPLLPVAKRPEVDNTITTDFPAENPPLKRKGSLTDENGEVEERETKVHNSVLTPPQELTETKKVVTRSKKPAKVPTE